jgi:hypothetical protein
LLRLLTLLQKEYASRANLEIETPGLARLVRQGRVRLGTDRSEGRLRQPSNAIIEAGANANIRTLADCTMLPLPVSIAITDSLRAFLSARRLLCCCRPPQSAEERMLVNSNFVYNHEQKHSGVILCNRIVIR